MNVFKYDSDTPRTHWFYSLHCTPVRAGVYELSAAGYECDGYAFWNGESFTGVAQSTIAAYCKTQGEVFGNFFWRGIDRHELFMRESAAIPANR